MSESIEMYLVNLARMSESGAEAPFPLTDLANSLHVQPVSANQMIHKLQEQGLVDFTPYKGVQLTLSGEKRACQVLRRHRLWEVFLVEKLNIPLDQAYELADRMEHLLPVEATERLAEFLGHPASSPTGKPIPSSGDEFVEPHGLSLNELQINQHGSIYQISANPALQQFLHSQKASIGTSVQVLAIGPTGDLLVETAQGRHLQLSSHTAEMIRVIPG